MEEVTILVLINDPHYNEKLLFLETKKDIFLTTKEFLISIRGRHFCIKKEDYGRIIVNSDFSMAVYCERSRKLTYGFYSETMAHVMKGELSTKIGEYAYSILNKEIGKMEAH